MENTWLENFNEELDKTLEEFEPYSERLFLDTAKLVAKKLYKHSKKCEECKKMRRVFLEYVISLRNLDDRAFFDRDYKYKLKALETRTRIPVHKHLKKTHHYKGTMQNRIGFVFYGIFLSLILLFASFFINFGWHWFLSVILLIVAWLIGYTLDKRNIKKGWAI